MIEIGSFSEFNLFHVRELQDCPDQEVGNVLLSYRDQFPNILLLLTETTKFYTEHFPELQRNIKREKRLVVFETPSRVSMTHEYTVEKIGSIPQGFHFLFNTRERLNWLKISLEGKRVSIASRSIILDKLKEFLGDELTQLSELLHVDEDSAVLRLYNASDGKPCFIEYNQKEQKGQQSLLFSITFFDSIQNKRSKNKKLWWSPLQEKEISYNYSTISGEANAWIYFKAPSNFNLNVEHNAPQGNYEPSKSNDDEITSLVLTPKGDKLSVDFTISIDVPNALKVWYLTMLYLAYATATIGVILIVFKFIPGIPESLTETFNNCGFAIIAALIATRGWLMSEEQVMKKISNQYSGLVCGLLIIILILAFMPSLGVSMNNDGKKFESADSIHSSEYIVMPIINYMQNNVEGKLDGVMKNTAEIRNKICDSIAIKNPCSCFSVKARKKKKRLDDCIKSVKINTCSDTVVPKNGLPR